jgi:hypothetical protein
MSLNRAIPLALVSLMVVMEIYASRVRRTDAPTRDRGSLFAIGA